MSPASSNGTPDQHRHIHSYEDCMKVISIGMAALFLRREKKEDKTDKEPQQDTKLHRENAHLALS
jgi:hypothetical protein